MVVSRHVVRVSMVASGRHSGDVQGSLTLVKVKDQTSGLPAWKAVLREDASSLRHFGVSRSSMVETVHLLLEKVAHRFSKKEVDRIGHAVANMQVMEITTARHDKCFEAQPDGSQPSTKMPIGCVSHVHQIYGLFRDDKPMSPLFQLSQQRWQKAAETMGAKYHLWSADEVDTLMRQSYPEHFAMYSEARFPVMRADMGRVAILHAYGGLYADLDTLPNRTSYDRADLAVVMVAPSQGKQYLDMEVLVGRQGNPAFISWLDQTGTPNSNR